MASVGTVELLKLIAYIQAMKEYDKLLKTKEGYAAQCKMLHSELVAKGLVPA